MKRASEQAVMGRLPGRIAQHSHSKGGEEHKSDQHADYRRPAAGLTHLRPRRGGYLQQTL